MILLALSLISLAAWIYLACFHGLFWLSGPELPAAAVPRAKKIAVIIPARDEAESIEQCLRSLLAQQIEAVLTIILVDDNSTDGTAQLAEQVAASTASQHQLIVLQGQPLEDGWSGKLWAVHQGLQYPAAQAAEFVLLTDADIEHAPDHLARLISKAESDQLELVSEMVHLHCATFAERALIPAFVFFFQMLYPFRSAANSKSRVAAAAGGTMLVARQALDRISGVRSIRHNLIDDCALAAAIKHSGGRIWLGHSPSTHSLRIYVGPSEIWNMIARTAYVQLRHSLLLLSGCVLGMSLLYVVPVALVFMSATRWIALATLLLMSTLFQPTLRRYRVLHPWGLALPAISLFYVAATVTSAIRHHLGRGGGWKARVYPG
jgi:hopene-associated glycosyltransferase HpnB